MNILPIPISEEQWKILQEQTRRLSALQPVYSQIEHGDRGTVVDIISSELEDIQKIINDVHLFSAKAIL